MTLPPRMVALVCLDFSFCRLLVTTSSMQVAVLPSGILLTGMKCIVSVPDIVSAPKHSF